MRKQREQQRFAALWNAPLPGWYADRWGEAVWRWWDGRQWTGHTHD